MKSDNIIAIVVGIGSYNDLGLIRSCGEVGVKSIYINTTHFNLVHIWKSKYLTEFIYLDKDEDILKYIKNISKSHPANKYILFGASDSAAILFDSDYNNFPKNVVVQHANGKLRKLMDKFIMGKMAEAAGLHVPPTSCIDINDYIPPSIFPIILKPVESVSGNKSDITVCCNPDQFKNTINGLKIKGYKNLLIQQYIHSEESKEIGITGIAYPSGDIEFYGHINKIRNRNNINNFGCYNPDIDMGITNSLTNYIKSTGYVGLFDTDFIIDNNTLYFIECNFRNGAYGYGVTHAGFNMPAHFIQNKPLCSSAKLRKTYFMEERTDILNVLDKTMSICSWIKDVFSTDTFLWWNWKDPRPMLRIPNRLKRLFHNR